MNNSTKYLSLALASLVLNTAAYAADVGVSVNISEPGFYGRIDIGRVPAPMVIEQRPLSVSRQPIYLHVPPGHEKHWDKHCQRYNACGQPVYFVQEGWYRDVYAPRYYGAPEMRDKHHRDGRHGKGRRDND